MYTLTHSNLIAAMAWLPFLAIPAGLAMIDFVILTRSRVLKAPGLHGQLIPSRDFTILVPIFGNIKYLKNTQVLRRYPGQVILCTTTRESSEFNARLERVARRYNFRIFRSDVPRASATSRANPWSLFRKTLEHKPIVTGRDLGEAARDEIIRDSFSAVTTAYCIFVDGDTVAKDNLSLLTGLMVEQGYDLASVRVLASKTGTLMEKLQSVEYAVAMDSRRIYPWLTSGAAMIARTNVIKQVMAHHSLFFSGGDIEIGKLASVLHRKVGHLDFVFLTDVPSTFKAWFKQRMAWCGGAFRHAIVNIFRHSWRYPFFFFYATIVVYGLMPMRLYEAIKYPLILPEVIVLYWIIIFLFHRRDWQWFYWLFPLYALLQVMIIVPLGIYTYLRMAYSQRNVGIIWLRGNEPAVLPPGRHALPLCTADRI